MNLLLQRHFHVLLFAYLNVWGKIQTCQITFLSINPFFWKSWKETRVKYFDELITCLVY